MPDNDIFGTFKPLTIAQIRGNARFIGVYGSPLILVGIGVAVAVATGLIWVAVCAAIAWISAWMYLMSRSAVKFVPRFGNKYNLLRFLVGGFLVYGGAASGSLLGIYNRLCLNGCCRLSVSSFGWGVMALSAAILLAANLSLNHIVNVWMADLAGLMEMVAATACIGSIMVIILYV